MKRTIVEWPAKELYAKRERIQYPDFQREPTVWSEKKRQLLIDSMLIGLDIPKIYLFKHEDADYYDCIDGQQRIVSVIQFFDGYLTLPDGRSWNRLSVVEKQQISDYKFTIAVVTEASEDDLRLLFLRLQLGSPLNVGEKLKALTGDMRDFIFDIGKNHPFFVKVRIPRRRFAKETVFAQICINSFYRSLQGTFYSARYEDLKAFIEQHISLEKYKDETNRIRYTLDLLNEYMGEQASELTNRASIVSAYLFFEELLKKGEKEKLPVFVEFYLRFMEKLTEQTAKGLDYDPEYRRLLDFQTNVIQAAVGKSAIETRQKILEDYFEYYLETKEIKKG